jgi:hypothetical protein
MALAWLLKDGPNFIIYRKYGMYFTYGTGIITVIEKDIVTPMQRHTKPACLEKNRGRALMGTTLKEADFCTPPDAKLRAAFYVASGLH